MDHGFGIFVGMFLAAIIFVCVLTGMSQDSAIISQCQKKGYWQMGQTRIKCIVENKS